MANYRPGDRLRLPIELPYECPDCGERHDGMTTGTERCPDCEHDNSGRE